MAAAAARDDDETAAAAAADAALDDLLLLRVEALLWELAPRARVVAELEGAAGQPLPSNAQQRLLLRALAQPPPHAPALFSPGYPPDYLAGVLQRATAGFMRSSCGALEEALAEMLQRALLPPPPPPTLPTTTEEDDAAPNPAPPDTASLLKTWCYLPPEVSSLHASALEALRAQADARRHRHNRSTPQTAATATATAANPTAGLVSLRLSPDIFAAGTGATTWAAGFVLGEWLLSRRARPFVKGRRVLELGSGAGLAGVCAWRAGAQRLRVTDADEGALANCRRNVFANLEDQGFDCQDEEKKEASAVTQGSDALGRRSLRLLRLQWDDAPRLPIELADDPDDLVIAADVAYDPLILPGLTRALAALLRRRRRRQGGGREGGGGGSDSGGGSSRGKPVAVVATTVRQEATLALLLDLARKQGLSMTEEAEWWRQRRRRRGGGAGEDEESEAAAAAAAAEAAAEGRAWGDDPRFVSVQGLDRRGIVVHVVELLLEDDDAGAGGG